MSKSKPIQISIPQPCHEDWNKMTPLQQGRFCDSCQKCVVDFTGFSDAQLYQFIADHKGQKICGRFQRRQLNRQINIPYQPHSTLYKWMMAAGLALIFVAAPEGKTFAQAPKTEQNSSLTKLHKADTDSNSVDTFWVSGSVYDDNNEPVIHATVDLTDNSLSYGSTVTDNDGKFRIGPIPAGEYKLTAKSLGFEHYQKELTVARTIINDEISLKLSRTHLTGLVEVELIEHKVPLINKYEGGGTRTITSDEIEKGAY